MFLQAIQNLPKSLDWEIKSVQATNQLTGDPLFYNRKTTHYDFDDGSNNGLEQVKALQMYRSDTGALLERVPSSYAIIPNYRFVEFVEKFSDDNPEFDFHGYQETLGGQRIYAFFKTQSEYQVNNTAVHTFLVVKTSHDQSSAFDLYCYQVELICTNGMMRTVKNSVMKSIPHSGAAAFKVKSLRLNQNLWFEAEQDEAARREGLTFIPVTNAISWAYAAYVAKHNPVTFFSEMALKGVGAQGISTRAFNTVSKIQSDVVTTFNERGLRNAACLESGLTRYFTHTNSINSKNLPLPMSKLVERFNGNYKGMMERSDKFMELLKNPTIVAAYNKLPTP